MTSESITSVTAKGDAYKPNCDFNGVCIDLIGMWNRNRILSLIWYKLDNVNENCALIKVCVSVSILLLILERRGKVTLAECATDD